MVGLLSQSLGDIAESSVDLGDFAFPLIVEDVAPTWWLEVLSVGISLALIQNGMLMEVAAEYGKV